MERPAFYAVKLSMTANASDTDTFTVPDRHEFVCREIVHKKTGACDLDELKASDGENLLNQGTPVELVSTDATRPVPLPIAWIVPSGTVTVKATDKSGATNTLDIALLGMLRPTG